VFTDPFGVLKDNEIQCKSSHQNLRTANGLETDTVLGDVLVCIFYLVGVFHGMLSIFRLLVIPANYPQTYGRYKIVYRVLFKYSAIH
jgi:hypothetical protein